MQSLTIVEHILRREFAVRILPRYRVEGDHALIDRTLHINPPTIQSIIFFAI